MFDDVNHPIWALFRLTILMVALTTILYLTASRFDETELRTVIFVFIFASSAETIQHAARKFFSK